MKKYLTLFFGVTLTFFGVSQTISNETLQFNNVDALVNDGGVFFTNHGIPVAAYNVPKGSGLNAFFAMSFWFGGEDVSGQLKLSAQRYTPLSDQFKGPLTTDGSAQADVSGAWSSSIFPMTQNEIISHQANYMNPGYVVPSNIANWPAHGDVSLNFDYYLAPFVDVNGDGNYDPTNGDYPCIRGDYALYVIMNDKGGVHASGGDPIGIEMHYMFYQYATLNDINNTTFVHSKLINRGTQTLDDFKVSVFLDGDLGNPTDDYFGSDSLRNLMYFYNGDNLDETAAGSFGYQSAPPAVGIISLTNDFESIGFDDQPMNPAQYWQNMNGMDANATFWTNPVTGAPTSFMFAADPSSMVELDSEVGQVNPPGDRKGIATVNVGTLTPNSEHEFDYALIYNRNAMNNVDNATGLFDVADFVQNYFDSLVVNDCISNNNVGINKLSEIDFSVYPNPSNGEFSVSIGTDFSRADIQISDLSGRNILEKTELTSNEATFTLDQPSGFYMMHLTVDGRKKIQTIVID